MHARNVEIGEHSLPPDSAPDKLNKKQCSGSDCHICEPPTPRSTGENVSRLRQILGAQTGEHTQKLIAGITPIDVTLKSYPAF